MSKPWVQQLADCGIAAFNFSAALSVAIGYAGLASAQDAPAIPVTAYKAKTETIDRVINGIGTVSPL